MSGLDSHHEYEHGELNEETVLHLPVDQFKAWLKEAAENPTIREPNAMTLSTVTAAGKPSSRIVLLRDVDEHGLVFFTNYDSAKGIDLRKNQAVSLVFFWAELERQVRIQGLVAKVSNTQSDTYFANRPRSSQLSALASEQSSVLESRSVLEAKVAELAELYPEGVLISRPENWGGYRIAAETWEFWQGRRSRLHDRLRYRKIHGKWTVDRLAP